MLILQSFKAPAVHSFWLLPFQAGVPFSSWEHSGRLGLLGIPGGPFSFLSGVVLIGSMAEYAGMGNDRPLASRTVWVRLPSPEPSSLPVSVVSADSSRIFRRLGSIPGTGSTLGLCAFSRRDTLYSHALGERVASWPHPFRYNPTTEQGTRLYPL